MEDLYARFNEWDDETRKELWKRWLWGTDCNAKPQERCCDMNEMHALGILVCLGESARPVAQYSKCLCEAMLPGAPTVVFLHPTVTIGFLSVRETLDQIECLQLNWGPVLGASSSCDDNNNNNALQTVRALMARIGDIALHAYPMDGLVLDDPQHCTPLPGGEGLGVISRKSLRQTICVLLSLLRVHHIVSTAVPVPPSTDAEVLEVERALRQHHIEASMDCFTQLQQMVYLAPGQRLAYRTLFSGMYNDVSQVVYMHHPRFGRKPQAELAAIPSSPLHMLPLITQLIPQIPIVYDDDTCVPGLTPSRPKEPAWTWLVACGGFFLVDVQAGIVFGHERLGALVAHYLRATQASIGASEGGTQHHSGSNHNNTPFNHVQLLAAT